MTIIQHTVKKSFRHCERSAAVHFLDCHVALLLAMTKQEELVAFFTDIPNLLHSIPQASKLAGKAGLQVVPHASKVIVILGLDPRIYKKKATHLKSR